MLVLQVDTLGCSLVDVNRQKEISVLIWASDWR